MHSFLCAMLFGMEKGRGRSSVTDAYSQYEPWHAPSFYAGALKFTVGQQKFYLERNFYSKEKTDYLRNELDGEELSVGFGDLTMLLGGVSKDSYASTYDITQTGAATGNQMVKNPCRVSCTGIGWFRQQRDGCGGSCFAQCQKTGIAAGAEKGRRGAGGAS